MIEKAVLLFLLLGPGFQARGEDAYCKKSLTADIVFALDTSISVSDKTFEKMKTFVQETVRQFISNRGNSFHFGVVTFANTDSINEQIYLDSPVNYNSLVDHVKGLKRYGTSTALGEALKVIYQDSLTYARKLALKFVIIVTDGYIEDRDTAAKVLNQLKQDDVIIFPISTTGQPGKAFDILAGGDNETLLTFDRFSNMSDLAATVVNNICDLLPFFEPVCADSKVTKIDLALVIDADITYSLWEAVKDFLMELSRKGVDVAPNNTRVGMVRFDETGKVVRVFGFGTHIWSFDLAFAIADIGKNDYPKYGDRWSYYKTDRSKRNFPVIADGLYKARTEIFNDARPDAKKVALLVAQNPGNNPVAITTEGDEYKKAGITGVAVGFGRARPNELTGFTKDDANIFFEKRDVEKILGMVDRISKVICEMN